MIRLKQLWVEVNTSLWFVPALMVVGAVALALGLVEAEGLLSDQMVARWPRLFGAGVDGSRGMLSAIASSMITITGVIFSITIVALTLASSQYTPRILRNFMRNRTNQFVLGFFVGVFAYCIIVLRTLRSTDEGRFVPSLAVLGGIALALASVGVLILFIHHIATSIQANTIISTAARETIEVLRKLFPHELGNEAEDGAMASLDREAWQPVPAARSGYIQSVDNDRLLEFARARNLVVRMECGIGDFIVERAPLVSLQPASPLDAAAADELGELYAIGDSRTIEQDPAFGIRQIVDIALKALSPGINDTTTAVTCVEYLGAILAAAARQRIESPTRTDGNALRVVARSPTFASLTALACDQIRSSGAGNVAVLVALQRALGTTALQTRHPSRRRVLLQQLALVAELAEASLAIAYDRAQVEAASAVARAALDAAPAAP